MLVAGGEQQEILVEYTRSIEDGYYKGLTPATGSRVRVVGVRGTFDFQESAARPGVYHTTLRPEPGERYTLRIDGPAGEVVTGMTTIPGTPRLLLPRADTAVVPGEYFRLHWSRVPAAGYVVSYQDLNQDGPSARNAVLYSVMVSDTTTSGALPVTISVGRRLNIAAVDSSYASYVRAGADGNSRPQSPLRAVVEGGYGVFGSVAYSNTLRVTVAR
jgi:hypothetical protein